MTKLFLYRYLGINISSQIELPDCDVTENLPEVTIKIGNVPEHLDNPLMKGVCLEAKPGVFLLKVPNIAKYCISNGDTIIIEPFRGTSEHLIRLFLFSNAFGALLHQKQYLPIHGSAIEINGKAIIFSGISGAGKSTLAASFAKKGFSVVADDFSPIKILSTGQELYSSFLTLKLWKDTLDNLELNKNKHSRLRNSIEKYSVRIDNFSRSEKLPVHRLYLLKIQNTEEIYIEPITGVEKFTTIRDQTFRYNYLKGLGLESQHFNLATKLASNLSMFKIYRENKGFEVEKLVGTILNHENSLANAI